MHLQCVPVRERLVAHFALHRLLAGVELLHMQAQVGLPTAGGGAQLALVYWLLSCMNRFVSF